MIQLIKNFLTDRNNDIRYRLETRYDQIVNSLLHVLRISIRDDHAHLIKHVMVRFFLVNEIHDFIVVRWTRELKVLQLVSVGK